MLAVDVTMRPQLRSRNWSRMQNDARTVIAYEMTTEVVGYAPDDVKLRFHSFDAWDQNHQDVDIHVRTEAHAGLRTKNALRYLQARLMAAMAPRIPRGLRYSLWITLDEAAAYGEAEVAD